MRLEHKAGDELTWRKIAVADVVSWSKKTAEVVAPVSTTLGELADMTEYQLRQHKGIGRQVLRQVVVTLRMAIDGMPITAQEQRTLLQLAQSPDPTA